jgi:AsmA protein
MKRIGLALAALVLLLTATAVAVPWLTPEDVIRNAMSRQIEALTGRPPTISGPVRLALLPLPSVSAERIALAGAGGTGSLLEADGLQAELSLSALLAGRLEVDGIDFDRPRLRLVKLHNGERSFAFDSGYLRHAAGGQPAGKSPVGAIRLKGGSIVLDDQAVGRSLELTVRDVLVQWPSATDELTAVGSVEWRGQPIDVSLDIADPVALLTDGASELAVKAVSDAFRVSLKGNLSAASSRFEGEVKARSPSLRDLIKRSGLVIENGRGLETFDLVSSAVIDRAGISFPTAQLEVDGNRAEGAILVHFDGPRPKVSGTLAADRLDVTSYLGGFEMPDAARPGEPISLKALGLADLDIRISSAETILGNGRLGRTAAAAVTHDGLLEVSIGEAAAYGGTVKGRLTFAPVGGDAKVDAIVDFEGVEMSTALSELFGFTRLEGTGIGRIEVSGTGASMSQLLATLGGEATFTVENGALIGVDVAGLLRRVEQRAVVLRTEAPGGRTPFDKGSASFLVAAGVAITRDARLVGEEIAIDLVGEAAIADRKLDLTGEAVLASDGSDAAEGLRLPFAVKGSWGQPSVETSLGALVPRGSISPALLRSDRVRPALTGIAPPSSHPSSP